jgi:hypothetical protein
LLPCRCRDRGGLRGGFQSLFGWRGVLFAAARSCHRLCRARLRVARLDAAFNDDVCRATDHHKVLDIVAPHEHDAPTRIHGGGIQNLEPRLAVLAAADKWRWTAAAPDQPQDEDQKEKCRCDAADGNHEAAAIGAHQFIDHAKYSL